MTPTRDEIEERALELWRLSNPSILITPEPEELKESGYWDRARRDLMTSDASKDREVLRRVAQSLLEELHRIQDHLGEGLLSESESKAVIAGLIKRVEELSARVAVATDIVCPRCGHSWPRTSSSLYATCSKCNRHFRVV